jgi:DNA-binding transcriptional LysR family regulator
MDRLTAMRSFIEVANTASFTKAAENLGLSRLQVSRHVQEVESWLQQRLLHRTTRKVSLTLAGEETLRRCEWILHETAELEARALYQSQNLSGTIRISSPIGLAQGLLLDVINDFTKINPDVTIDILASDSFSQLVDERIDIALRYTTQPDENLIARKLMAIDSVVCASPTYLKSHSSPNEPNDLREHNCFIHMGGATWDFIRDNHHYSVVVKGNIKANNLVTLARSAIRGTGIVRLPCDLANPLISSGQLIPLLTEYAIPNSSLWAVYLSRSYQQPVVRQFIDYVAKCWEEDIKLINL